MSNIHSLHIVGVSCATDETSATQDIGALWGRAIGAGLGAQHMYAVYRGYQLRPGGYTVEVVVGRIAAPNEALPHDCITVEVPAQAAHHVVTDGSVEGVQRAWAGIWSQWPDGGPRTFVADLEHWEMGSDGKPQRAEVFVGVLSASHT